MVVDVLLSWEIFCRKVQKLKNCWAWAGKLTASLMQSLSGSAEAWGSTALWGVLAGLGQKLLQAIFYHEHEGRILFTLQLLIPPLQYLYLLWDCGTVAWIYSIYGWAIKHISVHSEYPRLSSLPCEIKGLLKGRKPGEANGTNGKGASVWPNSTGLTRLKMHDSITQELANEEWGRCYSLKQMATKWIGCCLSNLCHSTKTWQDIFFTGYESSEIKKARLGPPTFRVCTVWP